MRGHDLSNRVARLIASVAGALSPSNPTGQVAGDLFVRDASAIERIPVGSDGDVLTVVTGTPAWAAPAATGATLGTAVTLSGTSVDFTGLPAGIRWIDVTFVGMSTNATSIPIIQLGDSGGVETSGYIGGVGDASSALAGVTYSNGFNLSEDASASTVQNGLFRISMHDASTNTWAGTGCLGRGTYASYSGGSKALSGTLDRLRITTIAGTATFDAGTVNILYGF